MKELEVREYLGNQIEFKVIDGEVYANATSMCKPFKKLTKDWLKTEQTKRYISALEQKDNYPNGLFLISKGGLVENSGTWIHEELILKLAQWLDVNFELFCDEAITTLLREGTVQLIPKLPQNYLEALEALVVSEKEKIKLIELTEEQAPKVEVYEQIANSTSLYTMKEIADLLKIKGLGRNNLIALLKQKEILTKRGEPKRSFLEQGYFEVKVSTFSIHNEQCSTSTTKVTGKGLAWLTKLLKPKTIVQSKLSF